MTKRRLVGRHVRNSAIFLFLLLSLVSLRTNLNNIQTFFGFARFVPANLIIDTQGSLGPMVYPWRSLAQGGESHAYQFTPAQSQLAALKPEYIRLDHLYDFYQPVSRDAAGRLTYDWSRLDVILNQITAAGAKPFLSLSYMPTVLGSDLTGPPNAYADWQAVVKATIEHVSGQRGLNLSEVYYEIWNEPDLFGNWKTYGDRNYLTLYESAARGANQAQNVNPFHLGGPATTAMYDNWVKRFFDAAATNNLRVDFYSYHHYSDQPNTYFDDIIQFYQNLQGYPEPLRSVELVLSEWGIDSRNHPAYDTNVSAAHAVAVASFILPTIKHAFVFEFQDGKDPAGQEYWGRWGLLTHSDFGSHEKPRYQVLKLLNRLGPDRISVVGFGTYVKALATRDLAGNHQLIIANFDPAGKNTETVPVQLINLTPGNYRLTTEFLGRLPTSTIISTTDTTLSYSLALAPNAVALLTLSPQ